LVVTDTFLNLLIKAINWPYQQPNNHFKN
jgi:hypothetical protein